MITFMTTADFSCNGWPWTQWILCSWTAAEYVCASAIAKLTGSVCDGPWTTQPRLGLGHVLISWSLDCSTGLEYQVPVHRGRWAGHRIAITTKDESRSNLSFNSKTE